MDAYAAQLVRIAQRACHNAGVTEGVALAAARRAVAQHYRERASAEDQAGQWADTLDARRHRQTEARRLRATAEQLEQKARQ